MGKFLWGVEQRELLRSMYVAGKSHAEIARALGVTERKSQAAIREFRRYLRRHGEQDILDQRRGHTRGGFSWTKELDSD